MEQRKLYLLLSHTGSFVSKCINLYTKDPYTHASISLDEQLDNMYSFGRLKPHNPLIAGFVKEDVDNGTYRRFLDTTCALYSININDDQFNLIQKELDRFINSDVKYGYNLLGMFGFMFNRPIARKNSYFCSQFVAEVLQNSGINIVDKAACMTAPNDFRLSNQVELVYEGNLFDYDRRAVVKNWEITQFFLYC